MKDPYCSPHGGSLLERRRARKMTTPASVTGGGRFFSSPCNGEGDRVAVEGLTTAPTDEGAESGGPQSLSVTSPSAPRRLPIGMGRRNAPHRTRGFFRRRLFAWVAGALPMASGTSPLK